MVTSNGHTILSVLNKDLPIDPVEAFRGIAEIASIPMVLIVPPESKATNLKDLIASAKEKPGTPNFASAGLASRPSLPKNYLRRRRRSISCTFPTKARRNS